MSSLLTDRSVVVTGSVALSSFFREELLKHQQCLQRHREYYTERTMSDVEAALDRLVTELEWLCLREDAEQFVSSVLKQLDVVTGLSAWAPPQNFH
jgi:hypothetical protein